jgi:hypothetical protein
MTPYHRSSLCLFKPNFHKHLYIFLFRQASLRFEIKS